MTHVPPRTKLPMKYAQKLNPPFDVSMMPDGLRLEGITSVTEAVDEFVRYCLAPLEGRTACITDSDGVVALGYAYNLFAEEPLRWVGTHAVVQALRQHPLVEPLLMESIEMAVESV